nr:MAG TPA: hypothetical protein [Caudoviricetes sp.]
MNYEFHVGDYVKTRAGFIGYIDNISDLGNDNIAVHVCYSDGDSTDFRINDLNVTNNFLRIGAYDFTKKEKKKIEPISDCNKHIFTNAIKSDNQIVRVVSDDILNKINELVDAVNKLMDKEDNE